MSFQKLYGFMLEKIVTIILLLKNTKPNVIKNIELLIDKRDLLRCKIRIRNAEIENYGKTPILSGQKYFV